MDKGYMIKNCGCSGNNVWRVHEVEYFTDGRGQQRERVGKAVTAKMPKPQAEQKLAEYKAKL